MTPTLVARNLICTFLAGLVGLAMPSCLASGNHQANAPIATEWLPLGPEQSPVADPETLVVSFDRDPLPDGVFRSSGDYETSPAKVLKFASAYPSPDAPHILLGRFNVATAGPDQGLAEAKRIAAAHGANWLFRVRPTRGVNALNDPLQTKVGKVPTHYVYFAAKLSSDYPTLDAAVAGLAIPDGYKSFATHRGTLPENLEFTFQAKPWHCYAFVVALDSTAGAWPDGLHISHTKAFYGKATGKRTLHNMDDTKRLVMGERATFRQLGCTADSREVRLTLESSHKHRTGKSKSNKRGSGESPHENHTGPVQVQLYAAPLPEGDVDGDGVPERLGIEQAFIRDHCKTCRSEGDVCLQRYKLTRVKCQEVGLP